MDSTKGKSKAGRDEKQATAKLDEQIEKVSYSDRLALLTKNNSEEIIPFVIRK